MRRIKRTAGLLLAGFLMFAPPGTLIFGALIILGLVGNAWLILGSILFLIALIAAWLFRKYRSKKL